MSSDIPRGDRPPDPAGRGPRSGPDGGATDGRPDAGAAAATPKRRVPLRLGPMVVSGEIDNTRPYAVCGWLKLRGQEHPLTLNLTGDAGENLRGKRVRFEPGAGGTSLLNQQFVPPNLSDKLAWQQVGPTGPMTLAVGPGGNRKLRLEWDSQNGRVLLELPAASVTALPDHDPALDLDDDELDALLAADGDDGLPWDDDDGGGLIAGGVGGGALFDDEDDDPFGLFPVDLQDRLDDEADDLDRQVIPGYDGTTYDLDGPDSPGPRGRSGDDDSDDDDEEPDRVRLRPPPAGGTDRGRVRRADRAGVRPAPAAPPQPPAWTTAAWRPRSSCCSPGSPNTASRWTSASTTPPGRATSTCSKKSAPRN